MKTRRQTAFFEKRFAAGVRRRKFRSRHPTLILVRNGTVAVRTTGRTYCAHSGSSIFLAPGTFDIEVSAAIKHGNVDVEFAEFSMKALGRAYRGCSHLEGIILGIPRSHNTGVYIQERTVHLLDRERAALPQYPDSVESIAIRILNTASWSTFPFARFVFFEKRWALLSLLETHFLRPRAAGWLGANYVDGRAAFFRDCKIFVGMSPAKWINTRRMELARAWLRHGKARLAVIAKFLGYCNARALRTALWKHFRMPLRELKDTEGIKGFGLPYLPMRPFWWPQPLPLIGREDRLVVPEQGPGGSNPEQCLADSVCTDFFKMRPAAVSKIIPFPAGLPELLAAA